MRCSTWSRSLDEDPAGTAARTHAWLALEQPGPWGAKAPTESLLDPGVGAALEGRAAEHGGRLALIKAPRSHHTTTGSHRVLAACIRPGSQFLLTGDVSDPAAALDVDWAALVAGRQADVVASAPWLRPRTGPVLLVCTNARRDACCALLGRPVAVALHDEFGDDVWEANHLGGHRFAPTTVLLPHGWSHARVDPVTGSRLLRAARADRVVLDGLRGHGCLTPAEQVAEIALRRALGDDREGQLRVTGSAPVADDTTEVTVAADGATHRMRVRRSGGTQTRPESCGKIGVPLDTWDVQPIDQEEQ